jgi:hypothetical protein
VSSIFVSFRASPGKACTTGSLRYEAGGLAALADRSHRPHSCSHQIAPELEARSVPSTSIC